MRTFFILILLLLMIWPEKSHAQQVPVFERKISVEMENETIEAILTEISRQSQVSFSYNPELLNASDKKSLSLTNQTVRFALSSLFDGKVNYRERGKFIILQPKKENSPSVVEGYLTNENGQLLSDATIYNADKKQVATTDQFGYFRLEIDKSKTPDTIKISKAGFESAMLMPVNNNAPFVQLSLSENQTSLPAEETFYPSILVRRQLRVSSSNIDETFNRFAQLSIAPHLGTNSLLSGSTSNLLSINILGGYTEEVRALELGGVVNIVRRNAGVFQAAGIGNFVGGNFRGCQASGVLNYTRRNFSGFQASGISNTVAGNLTGVQATGIMNYAKNINGTQLTGMINVAGDLYGFQASSILNQAKTVQGAQVTALVNNADSLKGAQITGVLNRARKIRGTQISGLLNYASEMNGLQLGVVNITNRGRATQIGIININSSGVHNLEIYATETFLTNIAYRGGSKHFHTILVGGIDPGTLGDRLLYTYGFGVGTSFGNRPKLYYDAEVLSQQITYGNVMGDINMLYKLGFSVNYKVSKSMAITFGLSHNIYVVDTSTPEFETIFSQIPPYFLSNESAGTNRNLKTWVGFKAGIRLF